MDGIYMTDNDWKKAQFFKKSEDWGDPKRINRDLIEGLVDFRKYVNKPIVIHCGTQGTHCDGSIHYSGGAVDLHVVGLHVMDQFFAASRFICFRGIGVYPHWHNPGLHLDIRPMPSEQPRARWMKNAAGIYVDISSANIKTLF